MSPYERSVRNSQGAIMLMCRIVHADMQEQMAQPVGLGSGSGRVTPIASEPKSRASSVASEPISSVHAQPVGLGSGFVKREPRSSRAPSLAPSGYAQPVGAGSESGRATPMHREPVASRESSAASGRAQLVGIVGPAGIQRLKKSRGPNRGKRENIIS